MIHFLNGDFLSPYVLKAQGSDGKMYLIHCFFGPAGELHTGSYEVVENVIEKGAHIREMRDRFAGLGLS